ncbi:MAG: DUF3810 domain-containing protein [Eubacterium sp.]|jgi:hypothetical protein|nr:DUF3810 domain-containing protein [Eubacterium sp.]
MKKRHVYLIAAICINIFARLIIKNIPGAAEWYADNIYPAFVWALGKSAGRLPFSLSEILAVLLIVSFLIFLVLFIIRMFKKGGRKKAALNAATFFLITISTVLMVFLFGCEINYSRPPFSHYAGINIKPYNKDELLELIYSINEKLGEYSQKIKTDSHGAMILEGNLSQTGINSMSKLALRYNCLSTYYSRPKPLITSELFLSNAGLCGIFSPFTIEANYNDHMPDYEKPFVVCHELSHLSGFMREDEANFLAYLACKESGDPEFIYSGYVHALKYSLVAYHEVADEQEYYEVFSNIPLPVITELYLADKYWEKYRSKGINRLSSEINDTYLKANGQQDGVRSYGRMVDLLIAERQKEINIS